VTPNSDTNRNFTETYQECNFSIDYCSRGLTYPGNATQVPGRFRKQVGFFLNAVLTRAVLQRAKNKMLTIFILLHTADP